jgi:hypothetical protein
MGYGEFGGGGSVRWKVIHGGNGDVHSDSDPVPKREPNGTYRGKFIVVINGERREYAITGDPDQIQIFWPPHKPRQIADLRQIINCLNRRTDDTSRRSRSKRGRRGA